VHKFLTHNQPTAKYRIICLRIRNTRVRNSGAIKWQNAQYRSKLPGASTSICINKQLVQKAKNLHDLQVTDPNNYCGIARSSASESSTTSFVMRYEKYYGRARSVSNRNATYCCQSYGIALFNINWVNEAPNCCCEDKEIFDNLIVKVHLTIVRDGFASL
jgi:hypothetical protein